MLNRSKGPAVRGPRAQADRKLYRAGDARRLLAETAGLDDRRRRGRGSDAGSGRARPAAWSSRDGRRVRAPARVVLTTGTFLGGLIHIGEEQIPAGRVGEAPSLGLSRTLRAAAASRWAG